ncbi:L10-interacting MYB domain-containing protein-like [Macadamia integrifolia]|uniref:L10-interacting MYB domain-containing protein-like n=1 Tax=Macadamia integrifolia TaxID=60698 RepID=UPI001C4F23B5|nr:L10-interacting MYB domain-containing protein-like [Macadamia integrifolia]
MAELEAENISPIQITSPDRGKAKWTPPRDDYLVELMIDQLPFGWKKKENGFTKQSWHSMTIRFNRKFGLQFEKSQLRNRYTNLRRIYFIIKSLISQNGFGWDEAQQIIIATDEVWDRYISDHPDVESYRFKSFPLFKKLALIFEGAKGKEVSKEGNDNTALSLFPCISTSPNTPGPDAAQEQSKSSSDMMSPQRDTQPKKRKFVKDTTSRHKKSRNAELMIAQAISGMALNSKLNAEQVINSRHYSYDKCLEELQELEGLDDSVFVKAVKFLRDEKNAIAFMTLKGPRRLFWLKTECQAEVP